MISQILVNHTKQNPFNYSGGDVVIRNSQLLRGTVTKKVLGGMFTSLLQNKALNIESSYSLEQQVLDLMFSLQRTTLRFMQTYGFSIGIQDVWEETNIGNLKTSYVLQALADLGFTSLNQVEQVWRYDSMRKLIDEGKAESCIPPKKCELKLEGDISSSLSNLRSKLSEDLIDHIYKYRNRYNNSTLIMSNSGSKGSIINQVQMTCCLSQQMVQNHMIYKYFYTRTLPHFNMCSIHNPYQFGFIQNSFFSGLNPFEFFFHTASGREGVIDTAIKTAQTGYIQRKLLKNLESIQVDWKQNVVCDRVIMFDPKDDNMLNRLYNQTVPQFLTQQLNQIVQDTKMAGLVDANEIVESPSEAEETRQRDLFNALVDNSLNKSYYGIDPTLSEIEISKKCI